MITREDLMNKARDAAINYRCVYGIYPKKIGIDRRRLSQMQASALHFPGDCVPVDPASFFTISMYDHPVLMPDLVRIPFAEVENGSLDEVYLPDPVDHTKTIGGERIKLLACEMRAREGHLAL
jgi:hypothetical protein